jgi:hypothetical protein
MGELDKLVAEEQGWTTVIFFHPHRIKWVNGDGREIIDVDEYTPSTDLNQAVAFAEWAIKAEP